MQWLKPILEFFKSDYLQLFWWLTVAGYLIVYGLANLLARAGQGSTTIVYQCRRAWGIGFGLHAIAAAVVMIFWYNHNGMFSGFWTYFPCYLVAFILDVCLAGALFASLPGWTTYNTSQPQNA